MVCKVLQPEIVRLCAELATDGVKRSEVGFILQISIDQVDRILKFKGIDGVESKPIRKCQCCGQQMALDRLYPVCPDCEKDDGPEIVIDTTLDEEEYSRFLQVIRDSVYFRSNISTSTRKIAIRARISCLTAIRFEIRRERELVRRREELERRRIICRDLLASGKTNAEMTALGWTLTFIRDVRRKFNIPSVPLRERVKTAKASHPNMTNSELASLMGIEERSVYDALRPPISKRREIQDYYREHPDISIADLADHFEVTTQKVFSSLQKGGFLG